MEKVKGICKGATRYLWAKTPLIITAALTLIVLWQFVYNCCAVAEMGEKYTTFGHICYQVLTLIPGMVIGVHMCWRLARPTATTNWFFKALVIFYLLAALLAFVYFIAVSCKLKHYQNGREHIRSFQYASWWWIYYWGVMMYLPTWLLCVGFWAIPKPISKEEQDRLRVENLLASPIHTTANHSASIDPTSMF